MLCTEATTPLMQMSTHKQRMSTGTSFPVLMAVALKKNFLMQDLGSTILRAKCNQKVELRYQPPQTVERVVFDKLVHLCVNQELFQQTNLYQTHEHSQPCTVLSEQSRYIYICLSPLISFFKVCTLRVLSGSSSYR